MSKLRRTVFRLLEPTVSGETSARWVEFALIILVFMNIMAIILESVHEINLEYSEFFHDLEVVSVIVFTIEYFLRIWTAVENPRYNYKRSGYLGSPMALIDLLSILPFYLSFIHVDLLFLRVIRLFRLFRLLKVARYLKALNIMQAVLRERREQLLVSIMFILFLLVIVSTLMYYVENDAQPNAFSSIPATMWWGIATLTTVGYGDMIPLTPIGKILGGVIAILGIGLFALPAGIFSSGLTEFMHSKKKTKKCPHCGGELHD